MNITPNEPNISPITKIHKLFKCLSIRVHAMPSLHKNVNNDVSKDSAIFFKMNLRFFFFSVHIYFLNLPTCNCSYLQISFSLGLPVSVVLREECPRLSGCNGAGTIVQDSRKS